MSGSMIRDGWPTGFETDWPEAEPAPRPLCVLCRVRPHHIGGPFIVVSPSQWFDDLAILLRALCFWLIKYRRWRRNHTRPARALCYRLAVATGLRYHEISTVAPESFDWKAPSVAVAAGYTKNGDNAELPCVRTVKSIFRAGRRRGMMFGAPS
jgi:hypothetical protein